MFTNRLLIEILRDALDPIPFVTKQPADLVGRMPIVYGHKSSGTQVHPKFADSESIQIDVYVDVDEVECERIASLVRELLYDAWWNQTTYTSGHLGSFEVLSTPFDFTDGSMPDDVCRYTAEYQVTVRPPA